MIFRVGPPNRSFGMRKDSSPLVSKPYIIPFLLIASLFFLWGFARSGLDVLNKHFQDTMSISISRSALVQAMTYLGYFLTAIPAGLLIIRRGYRAGVVIGLSIFALGAFMFIPGERFMTFGIFLAALFILGCGLAMLETSANPYIAELGAPATASSRLNLAQSLNGLGCILGPMVMGGLLFSPGSSVSVPYAIMGGIVVIAAVLFSRLRLPELALSKPPVKSGIPAGKDAGMNQIPAGATGSRPISHTARAMAAIRSLWKNGSFRLGVLALFFYEISEISINSLFINYAVSDGWMDKMEATTILSLCALGLFMLARIAGSFIMRYIPATKVLLFCALATTLSALIVAGGFGVMSHGALFCCYAFEAIMFPTIFALTVTHAGENVKMASSFMMMTPLGGAVGTLLMSVMAESVSLSVAFLIPAVGYAVVLAYAIWAARRDSVIHKQL